eukprot:TRINITY_DN50480_c0_g1_i1.p1 TRINITY_DN50480_c0_g1~~TRINITY_DN50480_c0_g1_i1.p1  ORF type:complete len:105 (-),score=23.81 TRINITY_DN50480_c0_g1_i1:20-334(-)
MCIRDRYVPSFATLTAPLNDPTKDTGKRGITWTLQCQKSLCQIQAILSSRPVLLLPDLQDDFVVRTDASSSGTGAVLLQEKDGLLHPVMFAARNFQRHSDSTPQ